MFSIGRCAKSKHIPHFRLKSIRLIVEVLPICEQEEIITPNTEKGYAAHPFDSLDFFWRFTLIALRSRHGETGTPSRL